MGALSALPAVEDANLVWQRASIALDSLGANGAVRSAFAGLKAYLAQKGTAPNLRFTALAAASLITADDGLGVGTGTNRVYGIFFKKQADATDAFISVVDNGTDDNYYGGSLTGSVRIQLAALESGETAFAIYPAGLSMANGLRVVTTTTAAGGTTVSADVADTVNGFIISGSA